MYNNQRQFNVNVYYKSSWSLYSSDKSSPLGGHTGDGPYAFSGNKSSFEKQDTAILASLKKWAAGFFSQHMIGDDGKTVQLKAATKASGDFDVVAKIL